MMNQSQAGLATVGLGLLAAILTACGPSTRADSQLSNVTTTPSPTATTAASPTPTSTASVHPSTARSLDPRYGTCDEAIKAGHGDYRKGVHPEYDWYKDADGDGIVCEIKK
jgi:hypothetical protein